MRALSTQYGKLWEVCARIVTTLDVDIGRSTLSKYRWVIWSRLPKTSCHKRCDEPNMRIAHDRREDTQNKFYMSYGFFYRYSTGQNATCHLWPPATQLSWFPTVHTHIESNIVAPPHWMMGNFKSTQSSWGLLSCLRLWRFEYFGLRFSYCEVISGATLTSSLEKVQNR